MPAGEYLLTIDIGNTTVSFALFKGTGIIRSGKYYLSELKKITGQPFLKATKSVAVSSVVPRMDPVIHRLCAGYFGITPFFVNYRNCGIKIRYSKPAQVGADRLANAVAGKALFGIPLIVVDFGTAITFDCINKRGEYEGGIILPGAELTARALHEHTAKLPAVNPFKKPAALIGRTTQEAIISGIYYGIEGAINAILNNLKTTMQCDKIVLTGGHAGFLKKQINSRTILEPNLTHYGIRIIWEKNRHV